MTKEEMIKRAQELIKIKQAAEKELIDLTLALTAGKTRGDMLECEDIKLRVCSRDQLDSEELKKQLSPSMWTSITKRVPVADLYNAAIKRGKLSKDVLTASMHETRKWLEIR